MVNNDYGSSLDFLMEIAKLKKFLSITLRPKSFEGIYLKLKKFLDKVPEDFKKEIAKSHKDTVTVSKHELNGLVDFSKEILIDLEVFLQNEKRKNVLTCALRAEKIISETSLTLKMFSK